MEKNAFGVFDKASASMVFLSHTSGAGPGLMNAATNGALQVEKPVGRFKIGMGIPSMITRSFDGKQVAIEGSWDDWRTRDFLQKSGKDFTINEGAPIRCSP
ncbi:uncharacterized protein LOC131316462 isoform X2 [Rhododendron vialii]|uniref:uncharacterized protein LOC131316462 isoform X2 n=1 Tax=Rhododendron vialii TaxID=182163 RepID=UPI00265F92B2|nr:uncharacterized protein LOC131316462 isoform X2 [Rhododendron vialii]